MEFRSVLRKETIAAFIFASLFISCSSNIHLTSYEEANRKIGPGSTELHLKNGGNFHVQQLYLTELTARFIEKSTGESREIKTNDIAYITQVRHLVGTFKGAWIGGAAGITAGYLIKNEHEPKEAQPARMILMGAAGVLAGALAGTAIGQEYHFTLPGDSTNIAAKY